MSDAIATPAAPATRSQPTRSGLLQVHLRVQKLSNLTQISTWSSGIGALSSALPHTMSEMARYCTRQRRAIKGLGFRS